MINSYYSYYTAVDSAIGTGTVTLEHMLASCDTPDSDWATLLVCVGVIFLILRHLRDEEDVSESPPTI